MVVVYRSVHIIELWKRLSYSICDPTSRGLTAGSGLFHPVVTYVFSLLALFPHQRHHMVGFFTKLTSSRTIWTSQRGLCNAQTCNETTNACWFALSAV